MGRYVYKKSVGRCTPARLGGVCAAAGEGIYEGLRQRMVDDIASEVRGTSARLSKPGLDTRVLKVMRTVPRHEFVRPSCRLRPMPIARSPLVTDRRSRSPI